MTRLPNFLKKYFWDVEFKNIDLDKRRVFVLKRIMELGDEKTVLWMLQNFTRSEIMNVLFNFRGLSQKSANFWTLLFDVPKEKVICLKKPLSKEQRKIWPY